MEIPVLECYHCKYTYRSSMYSSKVLFGIPSRTVPDVYKTSDPRNRLKRSQITWALGAG